MAKHTICHIEWDVTDLARAQRFYEGLFGWNFRSFGEEMVVFGVGGQHLGGLMKVDQVHAGNSPSVWIEVEDVEAMCSKAATLGGSVKKSKEPVPGVGFSAVVTDLDGNNVGMVEFAQ